MHKNKMLQIYSFILHVDNTYKESASIIFVYLIECLYTFIVLELSDSYLIIKCVFYSECFQIVQL